MHVYKLYIIMQTYTQLDQRTFKVLATSVVHLKYLVKYSWFFQPDALKKSKI